MSDLFDILRVQEELATQSVGDVADAPRLSRQLRAVFAFLSDGQWHTLVEIAAAADCSTQSASARVRDLRKERFGSHEVQRRKISDGLYSYRLGKP